MAQVTYPIVFCGAWKQVGTGADEVPKLRQFEQYEPPPVGS